MTVKPRRGAGSFVLRNRFFLIWITYSQSERTRRRCITVKSARKFIRPALAIFLTLFFASCRSDPQKAKSKYLAEGQKYLKKGQYGDASVEFRNALRLDPRFVDAYYQLAQADLAQRD